MNEKMTQNQRLDYLVEEFKADSVQYKDLKTPKDTEGKRRGRKPRQGCWDCLDFPFPRMLLNIGIQSKNL